MLADSVKWQSALEHEGKGEDSGGYYGYHGYSHRKEGVLW